MQWILFYISKTTAFHVTYKKSCYNIDGHITSSYFFVLQCTDQIRISANSAPCLTLYCICMPLAVNWLYSVKSLTNILYTDRENFMLLPAQILTNIQAIDCLKAAFSSLYKTPTLHYKIEFKSSYLAKQLGLILCISLS